MVEVRVDRTGFRPGFEVPIQTGRSGIVFQAAHDLFRRCPAHCLSTHRAYAMVDRRRAHSLRRQRPRNA